MNREGTVTGPALPGHGPLEIRRQLRAPLGIMPVYSPDKVSSEDLELLVAYGKQGRMTTQDLYSQPNAANCLTLIIACIIYWQAKEMHRVLNEVDMPETLDWALLEHISPVGWDNIILYREYFLNCTLNQHLVRT